MHHVASIGPLTQEKQLQEAALKRLPAQGFALKELTKKNSQTTLKKACIGINQAIFWGPYIQCGRLVIAAHREGSKRSERQEVRV